MASAVVWDISEINPGASAQAGEGFWLVLLHSLRIAWEYASKHPNEIIQEVSDAVMAEGGLNDNIQLQEQILFHDYPARMVIGAVDDQYWVMVLSLIDGRLYTSLAFSEQRDRMTHFLDSLEFADGIPAN